MKPNKQFSLNHAVIFKTSIIFLFLLYSITLMSQTKTDFSGKWTYDKSKSTAGSYISEYPGSITREIIQNVSTLTYRDIYIQKGIDPYTTTDIVVNLDGKEEIDKSDPKVTATKSLKWLQGNKSFIITDRVRYIDNGMTKEILITETYTLSDNGKTLTIDEFHKAELGETKTKNIYLRK